MWCIIKSASQSSAEGIIVTIPTEEKLQLRESFFKLMSFHMCVYLHLPRLVQGVACRQRYKF